MALVDFEIEEAVHQGELGIENYDPDCIQPASYDLRIGPLVYSGSEEGPDRPINLAHNGGAYRIPPYGQVLLMTYETLRLSNKIVGRFGLTSSYTRKNLHASMGPQVDPGYEGKLFVTLLNLTPKSHVVRYQEKFLSIEFTRLQSAPNRPYRGPYQGRTDISPDILEDLVSYEGLNLSQMQSQFTDLAQHVKEWSNLSKRFDEFLHGMERHINILEQLVAERPMIVASNANLIRPPAETRRISIEQAADEIIRTFGKKKRFYYSDVMEQLNLDLELIIEACRKLKEEGKIDFESE